MQIANEARRVIAYDSAADAKVFNLDKPASDNVAMCEYWDQTDAIIAGVKGLMAKPSVYLPKFPNESRKDWEFRQSLSKLTNVFRDIVEDLASRPFEAPVTVKNNTLPAEFDELLTNIDGSGNNLTSFAADTFFNGITSAVEWIFVDYPNVAATNGRVRSVADEKAAGIRPYWTHVRGRNMLEIRSTIGTNGIEHLTYCRILEPQGDDIFVRIIQRDDAGAVTWELWKAKPLQGSGRNIQREFILDSAGIMGIDVIPLVPFITGRRKGRSWVFDPALRDASDLQLNVFRNETNLEYAKVMTAYPMLSGNGVKPQVDAGGKIMPVPVGPGAALYAPPDGAGHAGSWSFIEIAATSLEFLRKDIGETITQLRELGRQPLTSQSGNLTVITTAVAAKKGNSAVQAWAGGLAMALAAALVITGKWKNAEVKPEVNVFTDFDVDGSGGDELTSLRESRKMGDLSQETLWNEYKRRNVLSAEFDPEEERARLLAETPVDPGDGENEEPGGGNPDDETGKGKPADPAKPKLAA